MTTQHEKSRAERRAENIGVIRDVAQAARRQIRYVCFRIQNGTDGAEDMPDWSTPDLVESVRELCEAQPAFTSWAGFAKEWDLGIDDVMTMGGRPEKWCLWGMPRTRVVTVDRTAPIVGLRKVVETGFGKRVEWANSAQRRMPQNRLFAEAGVVFRRADYERILEGVNERKGW